MAPHSTPPRLRLDASCAEVRVDTEVVRNRRAFLFWATLALRRDLAEPLELAQLTRHPEWSGMKPVAIQKEISQWWRRHPAWRLLLDATSSTQTTRWRIDTRVRIDFRPSREAVAAEVDSPTAALPLGDAEVDALILTTDAMVDYMQGRFDRAARSLDRAVEARRSLGERPRALATAWDFVLRARIAVSTERDDVVSALAEALREEPALLGNPLGRFAEARVIAAGAMLQRGREHLRSEALHGMRRHLASLTVGRHGALTVPAEAVLYNVIGVLLRRDEHYRESARASADAAWMFGLLGDVQSLQSALFNVAHALRPAGAPRPEPAVCARAIRLLVSSVRLCQALRIGHDTAQGELLLARWHFEDGRHLRDAGGDPEAADRSVLSGLEYLSVAEEMERAPDKEGLFDQATLHRVRAELAVYRRDFVLARTELHRAIGLFREAPSVDDVSVRDCEGLLREVDTFEPTAV